MSKNSMNSHNGTEVRKNFPIGTIVAFKPKSWCGGESLKGIVTGHLYVNLLIIKSGKTLWAVSVFRVEEKFE